MLFARRRIHYRLGKHYQAEVAAHVQAELLKPAAELAEKVQVARGMSAIARMQQDKIDHGLPV